MSISEQIESTNNFIIALLEQQKALVLKRDALQQTLNEANKELQDCEQEVLKITRQKESLVAAFSIAPEEIGPSTHEVMRQKREAVFTCIRGLPDQWIKPSGLAILTGIDIEDVCAILRRASKIDGIPLEHNGDRGRGSSYCWRGKEKE